MAISDKKYNQMIFSNNTSNKSFLFGTGVLVIISVLTFNVFYFSSYYGFVQVNYINSLFLVPFVVLIFSFGMALGRKKESEGFVLGDLGELTAREREVVQMIAAGKKNKEIADELFVELSTIKSHVNSIYKKTDVQNRKDLIRKYLYTNP